MGIMSKEHAELLRASKKAFWDNVKKQRNEIELLKTRIVQLEEENKKLKEDAEKK